MTCSCNNHVEEIRELVDLTIIDPIIEKYGKDKYRTVLAGSHWSVYILLGKLKPTVFIAQKH